MKAMIPNRRLAVAALVAAAGILVGCQGVRTGDGRQAPAKGEVLTPDDAVAALQAGNRRFVEGRPLARDLAAERLATRSGQAPFAVILSCLDSRASAERVFDQGLGDVFSARVAGNVINDDILGSMEFACQVVGARLIAVIGHTQCGAVQGACEDVELGHLTQLVKKIEPAVERVGEGGGTGAGMSRVDAVAREHVRLTMAEIRRRSAILDGLLREGKIGLIGGMHDLESGRVTFFE